MTIKLDEGYLENLITQNVMGDKGRLDADDTHFLARQLEHIREQTYDILFPDLMGRMLIPVDNEVDNTADTVTYRQWEMFGSAAIIANYGDDSPRVETLVREFSGQVKAMADSYAFSIQDLRAAAKHNTQLQTRKVNAARRGMEQTIDLIGAFGLAEFNLPGFLNFVNVPIVTLPTGGWGAASGNDILQDLHFLVHSVRILTETVHSPDTLILDTANFDTLSTQLLDPTNGSNITILNQFMISNKYVQNLDQWYRLDLANAGGDGPRAMTYIRMKDMVQQIIPQEFEQFPPQARNMEFVTNCHARHGGVEWHYPLSAAYADNI